MPQNLFKIYDGRNYFWQWDKNQKLIVLDKTVDKVHFSSKDMKHSIVKDVITDKDGLRICNIPDELLTLPKNLIVSACVTDNNENKTIRTVKFAVIRRQIPSNYVESENFQYGDFVERLDTLEDIVEDACFVQKFKTIEAAEQWAQSDNNIGAIISINIGEEWKPYVVEDDNSITPICDCEKEAIMRDISELRELVGDSNVSDQITQAIDEYLNAHPINSGSMSAIGTIELPASKWAASIYSERLYYQHDVAVVGIPENMDIKKCQIDLTPSVEQLIVFYEKDLTFVTENDDGVITVYAIGQMPMNDYTIQITITEVNI